ncbi:hypothetical protein MKZ38_009839 [Zalerion maritima]|uniref:MINDY deubiquitinase domain-containing protein n=1 Tax=Zalerion maritima TaxID=339359 RepID=A0AAD5S0E8_9PEZI|nr:hypothetical protein MKZ38_009839 [Zalerion maritima]
MVTRSSHEGELPESTQTPSYEDTQHSYRTDMLSGQTSSTMPNPTNVRDLSSPPGTSIPNPATPRGGLYDGFEHMEGSSWPGRSAVTPQLSGQSTASSKAETNPFLKRKMSQNGTSARSISPTTTGSLGVPDVGRLTLSDSNNPFGPHVEHNQTPQSSSQIPRWAPAPDNNYNPFDTPSQLQPPQSQQPPQPNASHSLISLESVGSTVWDEGSSSQFKDKKANSTPPDDWEMLTKEVSPQSQRQTPPTAQFAPATLQPTPQRNQETAQFAPPSLPARSSSQPRSMVNEAIGPTDASTSNNQGDPVTYGIRIVRWQESPNGAMRETPTLIQNENGPCPLLAMVNNLTLTSSPRMESDLTKALRARERITLDTLVSYLLNEYFDRWVDESTGVDPVRYSQSLKALSEGMNVDPRFFPTEEIQNQYKRNSLTHVHPVEREDAIPGTFEDSEEMQMFLKFGITLLHGWLPDRESEVYQSFKRHAASYEPAVAFGTQREELESKLDSGGVLSDEEFQMLHDAQEIERFLSQDARTQLTDYGLDVIRKAMEPGSFAVLFRNEHFSTLYRHPASGDLFALVTDAGLAQHQEVVWESLVDTTGRKTEYFSGDFLPVGGPQSGSSNSRTEAPQTDRRPQQVCPSADFGVIPPRGSSTSAGATSPQHLSQLDSDMAMALQLQEEENQRASTANERRRRQSQLSEQFIERQGRQQPGSLPRTGRAPSGSGQNIFTDSQQVPVTRTPTRTTTQAQAQNRDTAARSRSMLNPTGSSTIRGQTVSRPADTVDDAPPSYEQAARQEAFSPPPGHPAHHMSTAGSESSAVSPQASSTQGGGASVPAGGMGVRVNGNATNGRRPTGAGGAGRGYPGQSGESPQQGLRPGNGKRDKSDCVVM